MDFEAYIGSFKREEIAHIWFHMTAMTLVIAQQSNGKLLLVVEGAEREDEDGEVTTDPLVLGQVAEENRLKAVADLLLENYQDIAIEGDYSWKLVTKTVSNAEAILWSICWITTENDYSRTLPRFLARLNPHQIETIARFFPDPNDRRLLDLSNVIEQNYWSRSDDYIQSMINKFISEKSELEYEKLIRYLDDVEME